MPRGTTQAILMVPATTYQFMLQITICLTTGESIWHGMPRIPFPIRTIIDRAPARNGMEMAMQCNSSGMHGAMAWHNMVSGHNSHTRQNMIKMPARKIACALGRGNYGIHWVNITAPLI